MDQNTAFAAPTADETDAERLARLRQKAELQAAQEFDEDAIFAKLLADARDKRTKEVMREVDLPTDTSGLPEDYDVIKIFRGQNKQDLNYVPLSLNGLVIKVPRDKEVIIPHAFVVDVLEQMVEAITMAKHDNAGRMTGVEIRPAHRAPYNFIRKATTAEYKAFIAGQVEQAKRETALAA